MLVDLAEKLGADAEDVDPGVDGGQLGPLGVDRGLPSPRLRVVDDVVMKQRAGVEHFTDDCNFFLIF